ncbi:MAG TPA: hypothetical protein VJ697_10635, partial [Nitrososphaeraceae archaeon]|nr:hypothetical protein [Nitrososphaeraceae archaeon]
MDYLNIGISKLIINGRTSYITTELIEFNEKDYYVQNQQSTTTTAFSYYNEDNFPPEPSFLFKKRKRVTFAPDGLLEKVKLFDPEGSDDETNTDNFANQKNLTSTTDIKPTFSGQYKTISNFS